VRPQAKEQSNIRPIEQPVRSIEQPVRSIEPSNFTIRPSTMSIEQPKRLIQQPYKIQCFNHQSNMRSCLSYLIKGTIFQ
jgi:hypothetical protein